MGSTMAQGFAFGAGSSIAHRAVGSLFGGSSEQPQQVQQAPPVTSMQDNNQFTGPCALDMNAFNQCIKQTGNPTACDSYYQAWQQCQNASL